jgi:hypothetical protein
MAQAGDDDVSPNLSDVNASRHVWLFDERHAFFARDN